MKNAFVNKPLVEFNCEECGHYFSSNKNNPRVCPECQRISHLERSKILAEEKRNAIRKERPLKGFLRVVYCSPTDDLVINGDVPENSIKISIKSGFFSNELKMINFKGNVIDYRGREIK